MLLDLASTQTLLIGLIFLWTGFVRSGLGFGGAALGLPLMLFIDNQPLIWLPIIGIHLLLFTSITLRTRIGNVDWGYLKRSSIYIIPPALIGVFGLLNLPTRWLLIFIYSVTLFYALIWVMNWAIQSHNRWVNRFLLIMGGYVAGTSLTGAPLMVAVYMRNVSKAQLRDTLFVLWFTLVTIKMSTFIVVGVDMQLISALSLLPIALVGHIIGLKTHETIIRNDHHFKRFIGLGLMVVSAIGLYRL
ncbi:MAG: TSUP family transporter [Gammaproteobacteria bacterium]|nr:TSUP family transporter [Gammaproteobacteria bacterium]